MRKYYSSLIVLDHGARSGEFCSGRGWKIELEPNPECGIWTENSPANEIIILANSEERAQYVSDMIIASQCLYAGQPLTFESIPVFNYRAKNTAQIEKQILAGGGRTLSERDFPVACLIAAKSSQRHSFQYALFKYFLSVQAVPINGRALDPQGEWIPEPAVSVFPKEHAFNAAAITLGYSVIEELSLDIRASDKNPSRINGAWNPIIKQDLETRLTKAGIKLSEPLLWTVRGSPTKIERTRKPDSLRKCEWSGYPVRDELVNLVEAISYASWLRSKVSAHGMSKLSKSLTFYDVGNVQHLARRLLLEVLGFWRYYERNQS